jgi:hypothetical protein
MQEPFYEIVLIPPFRIYLRALMPARQDARITPPFTKRHLGDAIRCIERVMKVLPAAAGM